MVFQLLPAGGSGNTATSLSHTSLAPPSLPPSFPPPLPPSLPPSPAGGSGSKGKVLQVQDCTSQSAACVVWVREGRRERWREGGREGEREGASEGRTERGRERGREGDSTSGQCQQLLPLSLCWSDLLSSLTVSLML